MTQSTNQPATPGPWVHPRDPAYGWTVVAVAIAVGIRMLLTPVLGARLPFITLFPASFVAAWMGGLGPALLATLLGACAARFLFLGQATASDLENLIAWLGLPLYTMTGIATGLMGEARLWALRRAERLTALASEAARVAEEERGRAEEQAAVAEEEAARAEEEQLRAEDERLRADEEAAKAAGEARRVEQILASITDAFTVVDHDWKIGFMNDRAATLAGATPAELIGRGYWEIFPESVGGPLDHAFRRALASRQVVRAQDYQPRIDKWLEVTAYPTSEGLTLVGQDITERKAVEAALAEETMRREEVAAALDTAQALVREADGRITYWSSGCARLYGWTADEAVGQLTQDLLRTRFPIPFDEIWAELVRTGQWQGELIQSTRDGRELNVVSHWVLKGPRTGSPPAVIEVSTDVTAARRAEERLRQLDRVEAVGQLAGGMAHEANNQMAVVLGAAQFILRRTDVPEAVRRDVEYVREAAERTAAITRQLLAFSRRQILQPQVTSLNEVVEGLQPILRRTLTEDQGLVLRLDPSLGMVRADPGQLDQVLLNLTLNARDAMPKGGQLTIQSRNVELTPDVFPLRPEVTIRRGPYVCLMVSDTGIGMDAETLTHVFEPFFTTKGVGRGTGLGLSMVYGIVKQSEGYIFAYSEPGQGATFKIYLPRVEHEAAVAVGPDVVPRARGGAALVVEDDPLVRQMMARTLDEAGYLVRQAVDGAAALEEIKGDSPALDVVITDLAMPQMSGRELAERLAELRPGLPVLFTSGYTDDEVVRRGLLEADRPFLQKPFAPDDLTRAVGELLTRQTRKTAEPARQG